MDNTISSLSTSFHRPPSPFRQMTSPPPPDRIHSPSPVESPPPPSPPSNSAHSPTISAVKPDITYTITIPSCAGWFRWDEIHETERRILPEFFDGGSASRNPRVYKYYRDSIIRRFRWDPERKVTFTEARRGLVGDVGGIQRVFDFLETWGLINYAPSASSSSKENPEAAVGGLERKEQFRKLCSNCKSVCNSSYFTTDKADIVLCPGCFVHNNFWPATSSKDFKRVDISEETKADWIDKETLRLLEAVLHYGEDWKKVAEHVGKRSEKECVARFIKLRFGEQFLGPQEGIVDGEENQRNDKFSPETNGKNAEELQSSKRQRLTPLSDASNPIMAQVAFLSAMVGSEVAEAAAQAAIAALYEVDIASVSEASAAKDHDDVEALSGIAAEARSQLELQRQVERTISDIVDIQMKDIQDKIIHFEEVELLLEKERLQLRHTRDLLFADQLDIVLQHSDRLKSSRGGNRRDRN